MQIEQYKSGGHSFAINIPSTVEEYDQLAKKSGAALDAAIDHEVYHGTLGEVRTKFMELIAEDTGIKPREVGTGIFTGEGEEKVEETKKEKFEAYVNRVCAEKSLDPEKEPFKHLAARLSAGGDKEVKFDPSVTPRTGGGPKIPVQDMTQAKAFITGEINKATGKAYDLDKFRNAFHKLVGTELVISGETQEAQIKSLAESCNAFRKAANVFNKM